MIFLEAPFVEEISGMTIRKMLDIKEQKTLTMKLKFMRHRATFKVTNSTHETVTFDPQEMLGIVDLRSLGYYKIKQGVLQQNLSCMYHFESANMVCDQFNRLINTLRKEEEDTCNTDRYPWLDNRDERKHMTDRGILDKYINLEGSCLTKQEKQKLRNLIYEYKDTFSLRDEIGTCPNIKVEIDVMDSSPFFIRPFHAREIGQRNEKTVLLGNFEGRLFSLFKPSYVNKQESDARQESSDRLLASEHKNSQEQFGLSFTEGHIYFARKFKM